MIQRGDLTRRFSPQRTYWFWMLLFRRTRRVIVEPYRHGWSVWTHLKESFVRLKKELVTSRGVSDIEQLLCFSNSFSQQHFHLVIFDVLRVPFGSQMFPQVFGKLHRDHSKPVVNPNSSREGQQFMHECCETTKNVASTSMVMLAIPLSLSREMTVISWREISSSSLHNEEQQQQQIVFALVASLTEARWR